MSEEAKAELIELFNLVSEGGDESKHQRLTDISYQLSYLQIVEELFQPCFDSDNNLHMCLLMIRDILMHRGFLLSADEIMAHFNFLLEFADEAFERVLSQSFISSRLGECIAILYRLYRAASPDEQARSAFKEFVNKEDSPKEIRLVIINEIIDLYSNVKMSYETKEKHEGNCANLSRFDFDGFVRFAVSCLEECPGSALLLLTKVFEFRNNRWDESRFVDEIMEKGKYSTFLELINNEEFSENAARLFNKMLSYKPPKIQRFEAYFFRIVMDIINSLCQAANENNCVSIASCINECVSKAVNRLLKPDANEIYDVLIAFTDNAKDNPDALSYCVRFWGKIACSVKNEIQPQYSKYSRYQSSSSDDEEEEEVKYFFLTKQEIVFKMIFDKLYSIDISEIDNYFGTLTDFIDAYQNLWLISVNDIDSATTYFAEHTECSPTQVAILSLLCSCFMSGINENIKLETYICQYLKILIATFDAIEAIDACEMAENETMMLSYYLSEFSDKILSNLVSSRTETTRKVVLKSKIEHGYDISERAYHVLLSFLIHSIARFPENVDNVMSSLGFIDKFIDVTKTGRAELMKQNNDIMAQANGESVMDFSSLAIDDQVVVLGKYYRMLSIVMGDEIDEFLGAVHEELMGVDESNTAACIVLIKKINGAFEGASSKRQEMCISFLSTDDHKDKFIAMMEAQKETPQVAKAIASLYSYANSKFYDKVSNNEDGIIFIHKEMEILQKIGQMDDCNDKMSGAVQLILSILTHPTSNFAIMRYFEDDLLTEFVGVFFSVLSEWPREEILQSGEWVIDILKTLDKILETDEDLVRVDERISMTLSLIVSAFLMRSAGSDEIWVIAVSVLNKVVKFSDGTLGPLVPTFVLIIDNIINNPDLSKDLIKIFSSTVKGMLAVASDDVKSLCLSFCESYEEKYREPVTEIFGEILKESEQKKFENEFFNFVDKIRRFPINFTTLPQFASIFR